MDTNTDVKKSWVEPPREKPEKPDQFPSSSDSDFWGDNAEIHKIPTDNHGRPIEGRVEMNTHRYIQRGQEIICVGCPFEHSIPLDSSKFTVKDGQIVKIA